MSAAYVDTSCLVAIAFGERNAGRMEEQLLRHDRILASNLLEAELRSALRREEAAVDPAGLLGAILWIHPDRSLTPELTRVLDAGYLRGADLWHLAVALFADPERELAFLTLDDRQAAVARNLGFS